MSNDFYEKAFETFLEQEVYDEASAALFSLARAAFFAGWKARESQPSAKIVPLQSSKGSDKN